LSPSFFKTYFHALNFYFWEFKKYLRFLKRNYQ